MRLNASFIMQIDLDLFPNTIQTMTVTRGYGDEKVGARQATELNSSDQSDP